MKGNIGQLMKQAQQMQENMRRMQEQLATLEVEGQSGAGMVKVQMTGKHEVRRVSIDPSLVGEEREMLEDLVAAAFNDAARRVEAAIAEKMAGMTAGLGLPADTVADRLIAMTERSILRPDLPSERDRVERPAVSPGSPSSRPARAPRAPRSPSSSP